jgi:Flp pilus assembly protein TadD
MWWSVKTTHTRRTSEAMLVSARDRFQLVPTKPMHSQQALQALQGGRWEEALTLYQRACLSQPWSAQSWQGLSIASLQLQHFSKALEAANKALSLDPTWAKAPMALSQAHAGLGHQAGEQGRWREAAQHFAAALQHQPDVGAWESNLAVALKQLQQLPEALKHAQQAVALLPSAAEAHNSLATVLQELEDLEQADHHYTIALKLDPDHNQALSNMGTLQHQRGQLDQAETSYRRHLLRHAGDVRTRVNLAGNLLLRGQHLEGWQHYEARLEQSSGIMQVPLGLERWQGIQERCEQLVLVHEQGYGDAFQFLRYGPSVRPFAGTITYQGPNKLHQLALQSGLVDACVDEDHVWQIPEQQSIRWEALLSLPLRLGATPADPLCRQPYLRANPERVEHWKKVLHGDGPLIGLHWQGNPEHEITISRGRSFPLETLAPLADLPGIRLLSLQKGPGSEQLNECSFRDHFCPQQPLVDDTWSFSETAAILEACDLVITSDSGLAHLAAGLGRPTWILLMHIPEWRWGLEGESTAWYPSARLWRQRKRGDWDGVVQQLLPELNRWCKHYAGMKS